MSERSEADIGLALARSSAWRDLRATLVDLTRYYELLAELTRRDLRIRYTQAVLGLVWAVLSPLIVALSGWLMRIAFGYLAGAGLHTTELAGIAIKSLGWSFFIGALGFGTASVTANFALVTKVYFPRAVLPISAVVTQVFDSAIGAAVLALVLPLFGVRPTGSWVWIPVLVALLVLVTTCFTLFSSCANVFFRDAKHVVQLVISFGVFFTPVFYSASAFGPTGVRWVMLNPLGPVLEGLRLAVVEGHNLGLPLTDAGGALAWSPWYLAWSAAWAVLGSAAATVVFRRAEFAFAEYV
jgi:lipopolysaccharide transport system permease protein